MSDPNSEEPTHRGLGRSATAPARTIESLFDCKHYALVVGINKYKPAKGEAFPELAGAVADAEAIEAVLSEKRRTDWFDVKLLTDEHATGAGIKSAFFDLKERIAQTPRVDGRHSARVLLYFAGHGMASSAPDGGGNKRGFFLPHDAQVGEEETYLSMEGVRKAIDGLDCHHLLLVLDCCFAGAFRFGATRAANPSGRTLYEERVRRYLKDPACHVITSTAHDEKALDTLGGMMYSPHRAAEVVAADAYGARSPFAVGLVKGLLGEADTALRAPDKPDGVITGGEISQYIKKTFENYGADFQRCSYFEWPPRENEGVGEFVFLTPGASLNLRSALPLIKSNNPYRGSAPYGYECPDPAHPKSFFGRTEVTRALVAKVMAEPIVTVVGASGTGKSSLLCAGALPALQAEGWRPLSVVRPGHDPMQVLRDLAIAFHELDERVPRGERLLDAVAAYFALYPHARHIVVIDQLEDLGAPSGGAPAPA